MYDFFQQIAVLKLESTGEGTASQTAYSRHSMLPVDSGGKFHILLFQNQRKKIMLFILFNKNVQHLHI